MERLNTLDAAQRARFSQKSANESKAQASNFHFYAKPFNSSSARSTDEEKLIVLCNAAAIGVVKGMRTLNPNYISKEDFEDAVGDAYLAALTHANINTYGAFSYADRCGYNHAFKACKKKTKMNSMFPSINKYNEESEMWEDNMDISNAIGEDFADGAIQEKEYNDVNKNRNAIFWACFNRLSKDDQIFIEMKRDNLPSGEIAERFGRSIGASYKHASDIKKRFEIMLRDSGYYSEV